MSDRITADVRDPRPAASLLALFAGARWRELQGHETVAVPIQGVAVLFSAIWAGIGTYALTGFVGSPSIAAAIVIAAGVLVVDLTIMWWAHGRAGRLALVFRAAMIIGAAYVLSLIGDTLVFNSSVLHQIATDHTAIVQEVTNQAHAYATSPGSTFEVAKAADKANKAAADQLVAADQQAVATAVQGFNDEVTKGSGSTPVPGYGPVSVEKQQQLHLLNAKEAADESAQSRVHAAADADLAAQQVAEDAYPGTMAAKVPPASHDLAARVRALGEVARQNSFVQSARWALLVFFMGLDAAALLLKLAGRRRFEERREVEDQVSDRIHAGSMALEQDLADAAYSQALTKSAPLVDALADQNLTAVARRLQVTAVAPSHRRPRFAAVAGAAAVALIAGSALALTGGHPPGTPIRSSGTTIVALPEGGVLAVPSTSMTPGTRVTAELVSATTRTGPDESSLPPVTAAGAVLTGSTPGDQLIGTAAPIKLDTGRKGAVHGPMRLSFPISGSVDQWHSPTLATYDTTTGAWTPVSSAYDPATHTVSAEINHFSSWRPAIDWNSLAQAVFQQVGISNSGPTCSGPAAPNWLNPSTPGPNLSIQACVQGSARGADVVDVEIQNNHNYPQWVTLDQQPIYWWEDGGFDHFHDFGMALSKFGIDVAGTATKMLLAPNSTMAIGFTRGSWANIHIASSTDIQAEALYTAAKALPLDGFSFDTLTSDLTSGGGQPNCWALIAQAPKTVAGSLLISTLASEVSALGGCMAQAARNGARSGVEDMYSAAKWNALGEDLGKVSGYLTAATTFATGVLWVEEAEGLNIGTVTLTDIQKTLPPAHHKATTISSTSRTGSGAGHRVSAPPVASGAPASGIPSAAPTGQAPATVPPPTTTPTPPSQPAATNATARYSGNAFDTPKAGGSVYNGEVVAGQPYSIDAACYTPNDIGSNNGFWYHNSATGHWAAATLFTDTTDGFGAPYVNGGAGCGAPASTSGTNATARYSGNAFDTPKAGGSIYKGEVVAGQTYSIDAACYTPNDIGSNNGWWYRNAATGHWAAATLFTDTTDGFGAPRVNGGAGCT